MNGLRTLGNNTPIINSWAGDGAYWLPKDPKVTNYYFVTFASVFGDDPVKVANGWAKATKAAVGSYITGPAAVDGVVTAIKRARIDPGRRARRADGAVREGADGLGQISFSKKFHTVFGRSYRVIRIQNNVPKYVGLITAKTVAEDRRGDGDRHGRTEGTLRASGVSPCSKGVRALEDVTSSSTATRSSG